MPMKPIPTMPTLTIDVTPVYILVCVFPCFSILPTVLACILRSYEFFAQFSVPADGEKRGISSAFYRSWTVGRWDLAELSSFFVVARAQCQT